MNKHGRYYEIDLFRNREMFVIGVGLNGEVSSARYDGRNIYQWNGLDAEAMAEQMVTESGWERGNDHFPS